MACEQAVRATGRALLGRFHAVAALAAAGAGVSLIPGSRWPAPTAYTSGRSAGPHQAAGCSPRYDVGPRAIRWCARYWTSWSGPRRRFARGRPGVLLDLICEIEPPTKPDLRKVRHQIGVLSPVQARS